MDLIMLGAKVLTMDSRDRLAEAVAVEGGRISAVGTNAEVSKLARPDTTVVNLAGRTLIPGFVDVHNHFSKTTLQPVMVDCRIPPHGSINSILDAISAAVKGTPVGRWVWGWGFRAAGLKDKRRITRWELDEVAPDNPVVIIDGAVPHGGYANSAALKLAGFDSHTPNPPHGQILREDSGEPDGTLWEGAMDPIHSLCFRSHLEYYGDGVADLVYDNCMRHLACGITSVGDAMVVPEAEEMYRVAERNKKLPFVLHQMLGGEGCFAPPEKRTKGESSDGNVSDRLRGGTIKMFMDPVFPRHTSFPHHSHGHKDRTGGRFYTEEAVNRLVLDAHRNGLQVAIHCLDTWSVEQALNAFERAQKAHPRPEPRHRIEHYFLPTVSQIRRTAALGVIASMQPSFVITNADNLKRTAEVVGGDVRVFPFKTMLDEGVTIAASSDAPAAPLEPLVGLSAVVSRRTRRGEVVAPEEAITAMEGIRMYTINSAYAMSREREVGSLEKGKRADMVVLSHDPTAVSADAIRDIYVERTYVEGQLLHQR